MDEIEVWNLLGIIYALTCTKTDEEISGAQLMFCFHTKVWESIWHIVWKV